MNSIRTYCMISASALICAIIFFAWYNEWIIVNNRSTHAQRYSSCIEKKRVTFFFFHKNQWVTEAQDLLWTTSMQHNLFLLINAWLTVLDEEKVIPKKIALESALLSSAGCAYLSFDHAFLQKEDTIFKKWMLIEGLLKTIRAAEIPVTAVQLLVHHQPHFDPHLYLFAIPLL